MGLIIRLAWRNLRRRPGQAVLLLLVMCVSTTTVSLALAIDEAGFQPWDRLHYSINGFHVQTYASYHTSEQLSVDSIPLPDPANVASADGLLARLAGEPGVTAVGGPWPHLLAEGQVGGVTLALWAEVRDSKPAAVSQPLITSGNWLDNSDDTVVLEDGLASLLKVKAGDEVSLAGQRLRVLGSAMTTSVGRYPTEQPATVWVNRSTAAKLLTAKAIPLGAVLELRLARAQDAEAFVAAHAADPALGGGGLMRTWQLVKTRQSRIAPLTLALTVIAMLLAGLTVATAAVLVTGRMAAQSVQIGALKAIGVTPRQALAVALVEYLSIAMAAAVMGIVSGTLLAPLMARGMVNLYGAPAAPAITWQRALTVLVVALAVVIVGSVQPALRGVRHSTVRALGAGVRPPKRSSLAARLAARAGLPLPAVLGLRSALRRPGRTIANATGLALGVAMVIVGMGVYRGVQNFRDDPGMSEQDALAMTGIGSLIDQLQAIVLVGAALLVALAALNAMVVAIFAARDNAGNHAILRAVGATPRQTVVSFVVAQLGASLLGCAAGIPLGVLLFNSVNGDSTKGLGTIALPASVYVAVAVAAPLLYLLVVIVPAARLARRPVAGVLSYE
jgi:putative ABC transport system permease protein